MRPAGRTSSPMAIVSGVAGGELERLAADEAAGPNLRAAQVLQDGHLAAGPLAASRIWWNSAACSLRAVREVQAEDVHPGSDQRVEHGGLAAGGAEGGDDLGVAHERQRKRIRNVVRVRG